MELLFPMLGILLAFASVLFLAYVVTRLIAGKTKKAMGSKYISIIDTINLGLDKHIHLIKVENQYLLIASFGKSIEFLTNVKIEDYNQEEDEKGNNIFDFKSVLDKYVNVYKEKRSEKAAQKRKKASVQDIESKIEFTEKSIFKSNVNKLRDITDDLYKKGREDGDDS
jgi:flagellar biogenesis protein FliO